MVPLTTYAGSEREPTFSPDGSQVAFSWDGASGDNWDIYVKMIGSEHMLRLTFDPAPDRCPAWAPDGRLIAFLRGSPGGGSEVRFVSPLGGADRRVAKLLTPAEHGLSWNPDGRRIVVSDRSAPDEAPGLFVVDLESGRKERLTLPPGPTDADYLPAMSPDGRTLAFARVNPENHRFYLLPATGGEARELTAGLWGRRPAWTADGSEILFTGLTIVGAEVSAGPPVLLRRGGRPGAPLLWRISVDGGEERAVDGTTGCSEVAVSRDGSRLACSQVVSRSDIWQLDLERAEPSARTQTPLIVSTRLDANPRLSPDGSRVAFTSARSGYQEIWVADRDGSNLIQVTSLGTAGAVGSPRWSPGGRRLAFDFVARGEKADIYVVSASGGPPRRITEAPSVDLTPTWSRDGRWIYYGSDRSGGWQVWTVAADGELDENARQVTRGGGYAPTASLDGRHVYFARYLVQDGLENALWRIRVEGGDEEEVVESIVSAFQWDLTAEGIYFTDRQRSSAGGGWVVKRCDLDGGRVTVVAETLPPALFGPGFSVSSDGRRILSMHTEEEADLMLAENFR